MPFVTTDLCDLHGDAVHVAEPLFHSYGRRHHASGPVVTLHTRNDNTLVRAILEEPGQGRVLVVDGKGSLEVALLGGNLAAMAARNGWSGVLIHGAVRDRRELADADLLILALALCPRRSLKNNAGSRDIPVRFAGVTFTPGDHLYADEDGVLVSPTPLLSPT